MGEGGLLGGGCLQWERGGCLQWGGVFTVGGVVGWGLFTVGEGGCWVGVVYSGRGGGCWVGVVYSGRGELLGGGCLQWEREVVGWGLFTVGEGGNDWKGKRELGG